MHKSRKLQLEQATAVVDIPIFDMLLIVRAFYGVAAKVLSQLFNLNNDLRLKQAGKVVKSIEKDCAGAHRAQSRWGQGAVKAL
jgi:hypothetical protein